MEVSNHFPAVWLLVVACAFLALATRDFIQVVSILNFVFWFGIAVVWTVVISFKAITSTDEPEGKTLA